MRPTLNLTNHFTVRRFTEYHPTFTSGLSVRRRTGLGFTLIEVLVVIGIIALLISLLLPAINKAISKSRDLTCSSNLRQLGIAFNAYATENKGYLPYPVASLSTTQTIPWQLALWKYLFHQPQPATTINPTDTLQFLVGTVFTCPRAVFDPHPAFGQSSTYLNLGYDMNIDLPGPVPTPVRGPSTMDGRLVGILKRIDRVRTGSDTLLCADGVNGIVSVDTAGDRDGITAPTGNEFDAVAHPYHQNRHPKGNIFCLMCDGSAGPKPWIYDKNAIPIPVLTNTPDTYDLRTQMFWFGHVPDSQGD